MNQRLQLNVNGARHTVETDPARPLLWVLRNELDLLGTHYGCGEGMCGACTVLLDGHAVKSCVTTVGEAAGKSIVTIEGLAKGGKLHAVQQAFLDEDAMQCGYCTPGMILTAAALLQEHPHPTREQIVAAMNGNVCRCGTYGRIIKAVERAAGSRT
ncbi:MAG: (2Fe-2S)-binding protein [Armatimonadetes bacterium]|nr:(2Fe-2S)-binding protein [Armatimonadota bacterium]